MNDLEKNKFLFILSLFSNFFTLIMVLIFYFVQKNQSEYVHYTNCYQPISDYAVEPGKSSDSILNNCGPDKNQKCSTTTVDLKNAVSFAQKNNSDKFVYNEKTGFTALLDNKTKYKNNPQSSIYTKTRHNINQDADDARQKETPLNESTTLSNNIVTALPLQPISNLRTTIN